MKRFMTLMLALALIASTVPATFGADEPPAPEKGKKKKGKKKKGTEEPKKQDRR